MQVISLFFYFTLVDLHSAQDDTLGRVGGALYGAIGVVFMGHRCAKNRSVILSAVEPEEG